MVARYRYTSHESIRHDTLEGLGFDWERIADPTIPPRCPIKVYLPQTSEDVVAAVREAKALGETLVIRGSGHSSNDLVLADRGVVLCTLRLNRILALDEKSMTVTVQAGAITADLDAHLAGFGYGLPVLGDHNDITAGGFASAGGIGPASHRVGLFVDNVVGLTYVDHEGRLRTCDRERDPGDIDRVLAGTGRHGIIVTLTLRILRVAKTRTILRNDRSRFWRLERFLEASRTLMADAGGTYMQRGFWFDMPFLGRHLRFGRFYAYRETSQSAWKTLRNRFEYGYLQGLGRAAGRLPTVVDRAVKGLGFLGMIASPKYGSIKNVESFTDRIMDSTVGEPTRWLILLAPLDAYAIVFRRLYELAREVRTRHGCLTFVACYVKGIRSPYLAGPRTDRLFCELTLYMGIAPAGMSAVVLDDFVSSIDDLCIEHGAFRYMHTLTVKDEARRHRIDPNWIHAGPRG